MPWRTDGRPQRLGTYFDLAGQGWRVNGRANRRRLELWIDWDRRNPPPQALAGARFSVQLSAFAQNEMAGHWSDPRDGLTKGFVATLVTRPQGTPRTPELDSQSLQGQWTLSIDGVPADLHVSAVDEASRAISGSIVQHGQVQPISGNLFAGARGFQIAAGGRQLAGWLHATAPGVLSGTSVLDGWTVGLRGQRVEPSQSDPDEPSTEPPVCQQRPWLPQCQP